MDNMARFKFNDGNILASLDLGSSSIRCVVSRKGSDGLELISFYEKECEGLEEGRIVDFYEVVPVVGEVLEASEKLSNTFFSEVFLGFSTPFHSFQSHGMAALSSREVTKKDQELAIKTACAVPIPNQHIRLHNNPQEFSVDGKKGIFNPLGLSGLRLEVEVHVVTIPRSYCQDMTKVLKVLGCKPKGFINNLIAFGENLTSVAQKKEGVCFCDIGHKSSRLITYYQGKSLDMIRIPIGGEHFSSAIAKKFKISPSEAQKLKEHWGTLQSYSIGEEEQIEVDGEGLFFSYKKFVNILEEVAKDLFESIKHNVDSKNLTNQINSGYIFTGSTSFFPGFLEMARFHLGKPVFYPRGTDLKKKNFKQQNAFTISQQAYLKERFQSQDLFHSKWSKLRDLF